jgi:hypothetical protein
LEFLLDCFSPLDCGPRISLLINTLLRTFQLMRLVMGTPHGATVSFFGTILLRGVFLFTLACQENEKRGVI